MVRSVVLLVLLSFVVSMVSAYRWYCHRIKTASNCKCVDYEGKWDYDWNESLECPAGAKIEIIASSPSSFYHLDLQCTGTTNMSRLMGDLSGLLVGNIKGFKLTGCTLSNLSIKEIMSNAGINKVDVLSVDGTNNTTFQKRHFENLGYITTLIISNTNLTELPADLFEGMGGLTSLQMEQNDINFPEGIFSTTPKLVNIDLEYNRFIQLKRGVFENLNSLTDLKITTNDLVNFTNVANLDLPSLITLDLSYNDMNSIIPGFFDEAKNLKRLILNGNGFVSLPQGFLSKNVYIEEFRMMENRNEIVTLPQGFLSNLPELRGVYLTESKIMALPEDSFWNSKSIEHIAMNDNLLTNLSENIFRDLTHLRYLTLSGNHISHLPEGLLNNTIALETLDFSKNHISHLPGGLFENNPDLKHLDLSENHIYNLPKGLFNRLSDLNTLKLNNNRIKTIPIGLLEYTGNLEYLYLGFNQIEEMAGDIISRSPWLRILDISNNNLSQLPENFYLNYKYLEELKLANNSLTEVPRDFWQRIQQVDLSFNLIQSFQITNYSHPYLDVHINLTNNKINRIYVEQIHGHDVNNINDKHLYLNNNPLTCDCHLLPFLQFSRGQFPQQNTYSSHIKIHYKSELKCSVPQRLSNMNIDDVIYSSLTCDLSHWKNYTCPTNCYCDYRPIGRRNIITCQDAGLTRLPEQLSVHSTANHTELNFQGNHLQSLQIPFSNGYENVTHWRLPDNDIADITFDKELATKLELLDLSYNKFSQLSEQTIEFIKSADKVRTIALHGNRWKCDCDTKLMRSLLIKKFAQITYIHNVTCPDGKPIVDLKEKELCPEKPSNRVNYFAILGWMCGVFGLVIATLTVFYHNYQQQIRIYCFSSRWKVLRWMVSRPDADEGKKYDAFISYAYPDESFVLKHLVPYLETNDEAKFKLCLHFRDWMPGGSIHLQILKSIKESHRTIVVLSPSYLTSDWGKTEFIAAYDEALTDGRMRLIVILFQDIGPIDELEERIRIYLQMNTYLKWESRWFWQQLSYAMPHPSEDDDEIRCVFCRRSNRNESNDYLSISQGEMLSMNNIYSSDTVCSSDYCDH